MTRPILLVSDTNKNIYDMPGFLACGTSRYRLSILGESDLIPLPPNSEVFTLPDRKPIGFSAKNDCFQELPEFYPVAAFIPPGYTQLLSPAYTEKSTAKLLPLFSYTPIAWHRDKIHVPATRIDKRKVHDIRFMDMQKVGQEISRLKNLKNRLLIHLETCALIYKCPNAINFFLGRYECPLPSSPRCNSRCLGCISFQPKGSCPETQERITFVPQPNEIAEIALMHINRTQNPIVSFGQGCEGEPSLAAKTIAEAIQIIRGKTGKGTINMNTNASRPDMMELLYRTGLNSIRVSLNSAREEFYNKYYMPVGYSFKDIIKSIQLAKKAGIFVSINYLVMPGFTDEKEEFDELIGFIKSTKTDMIQWRNLNYDPREYFRKLKIKRVDKPLGIKTIMAKLKKLFPKLRHGYFNLPKELW